MTRRLFAALFVCLAAGSVAAVAADKPDFSGNWKLNTEKSDFGPMPKPQKVEYVIAHKDPQLSVKSTAVTQTGEVSNEVKMTTDGKEFTNTLHGQEIKGTAKWEGQVLIVTQKIDMQGTELVVVQKWTMADDGKSISQEVTFSGPQGELKQTAVLDKV
jgi:hypothetical protein